MSNFTCWSPECPEQGEVCIDAPTARFAAERWLEERWPFVGESGKVRVSVRSNVDGAVNSFDVYVLHYSVSIWAKPVDEGSATETRQSEAV